MAKRIRAPGECIHLLNPASDAGFLSGAAVEGTVSRTAKPIITGLAAHAQTSAEADAALKKRVKNWPAPVVLEAAAEVVPDPLADAQRRNGAQAGVG